MRQNIRFCNGFLLALIFLLNLGVAMAQQPSEKETNFRQWQATIKSSKSSLSMKMNCYNNLMDYYLRSNGDSSNYYADLALAAAPIVKDDTLTAYALNNKSILLVTQLKFDEALEYAFSSLKISERLDDKRSIANDETNIAGIFLQLKKNEDAKTFLKRGLATRMEIGDSVGVAASHLNLASLYSHDGEDIKALAELKKALHLAEILHHDDITTFATHNIASTLIDLGKFAEADIYLRKTIDICQKTHNKSILRSAYKSKGKIFFQQAEYDSAIVYFSRSIEIGNEMQDFSENLYSYEKLAESYEKKGDYGQAIHYLRLVQQTSDAAFSKDLQENVAKFQVQYETDRLTREKLLALSEKREIATALFIQESENEITNLKLSRNRYIIAGLLISMALIVLLFVVLQMRSKLKSQVKILELKQSILQAQMNPHFIFNALNSIQNQILNRDRKDAYAYHSKFSELMRTVLEASNRETISLEEEISAITNYLDLEQLRTDDKFDYTVTVDPKLDLRTTMVPPLLIQPFAENSVWHGLMNKEGKGNIQIDISARPTGIHYSIEDNGIGRKRAGEFNKLQSKNHASRGVEVTNERVRYFNLAYGRQLEMQISDLSDAQGQASGTRVEIEIPYL